MPYRRTSEHCGQSPPARREGYRIWRRGRLHIFYEALQAELGRPVGKRQSGGVVAGDFFVGIVIDDLNQHLAVRSGARTRRSAC